MSDNKRYVKTYDDHWQTDGIKLDLLQSPDFYYLVIRQANCRCGGDEPQKRGFGPHNQPGRFAECKNYEETSRIVKRKYEFELYEQVRSLQKQYCLPVSPARINNKQDGQIRGIVELAEKYKNGAYTYAELQALADDLIRD